MSNIHKWQTCTALAEMLGVSESRIRNMVGPGELVEQRDWKPTELQELRETRRRLGLKGRVTVQAFRVKPGVSRAAFQKPDAPPPKLSQPVLGRPPAQAKPRPPKAAPQPQPEMPGEAPPPLTVFPALLTYLTTDPQHFTEQLVQLVASAWPEATIISLSLCLDAELYSARLPARDATPNPDPTAPTTQET